MEIKEKIKQLRDALHEHNYLYYILDAPKITDFEFDQMLKALQDLERKYPEFFDPNSPTQRVGGGGDQNTNTSPSLPILLSNTYSKEELLQWVGRVEKALGTKNLNLRVN